MKQFKAGDKVICQRTSFILKKGRTYTVGKKLTIKAHEVYIREVKFTYPSAIFELVDSSYPTLRSDYNGI